MEKLGFALEALGRQNFKQESSVIKFSFRDQCELRPGGGLGWRRTAAGASNTAGESCWSPH